MLSKNAGIHLLMLLGLTSITVVPTWLIAPEITSGQTRVQGTSFMGIFNWLLKKGKKRPISREPAQGLCLVTPNGKIYSTNPLFLWQGNLKAIAVSKARSNKNFWKQEITSSKNLALYKGEEVLQPGQSYDWKGFPSENPTLVSNFQVMSEEERQKITDGIKALEKRLQMQGADKKTVALERATFFTEQELWSDALQELYSVPNVSKDLSSQTEYLVDKLCES